MYSLGVVIYKNGDKYRGMFKDGRPCGSGVMKYNFSIPGPNGSDHEEATYEGQFKAGKREGLGTMTWADHSVFVGVWKNDMRHKGEIKFSNGNCYRGEFQNDQLHGNGKLLMSSGVIYDGVFS